MTGVLAALWSKPRVRAASGGAAGVAAVVALDLAVPSPVVAGTDALMVELVSRAAGGLAVGSRAPWIVLLMVGIAVGVAYGEGFRAFTRTGAIRAGTVWGLAIGVLMAPFVLPFGAQIVTLNSLQSAFALVSRWFLLYVAYGIVVGWVADYRAAPAPKRRR